MKKHESWSCDICGTNFKDKKVCDRCEKGHKKAVDVLDAKYVSVTNDQSGFPVKIAVKMDNGEKVWYKRITQSS